MSFDGIEFENLSWYEVDSAFRLLENSPIPSIRIKGGDLVAICGPVGSGKSALIHLLAGSNISNGKILVKGSINIVGRDGNFSKRCTRCWYDHIRIVPHVDQLIPTLKCQQVLEIAMQLHGEHDHQSASIAYFLNMMNMRPFAQSPVNKFNHQVDIHSRGNLKKLSILQAMITRPRLLLVDEPAYLVDLQNLEDIVDGLKAYATDPNSTPWMCKHCKINLNSSESSLNCVIFAFNSIILPLKQFSLLKSFDKVILMSVTRQIIFYGTFHEAVESIGHGSVDGLISALEWTSLNKDETKRTDNKLDRTAKKFKYHLSWYKQVWILFKRHCFQVQNFPKQVIRVILQRILIFIILSFIFAQPKTRGSFFGIFFFLPINQTANILLFTATEGFLNNELIIIERARFGKSYKTWTLITAKILILIPINVLPALFYLPAVYFIADFNKNSSFYIFTLANILHIICTIPLGIFIASSSQDPFIRDLWLFGITTLFTTFGGIHTAADFQLTWILRWIQYISPTFYLFLILVQLEYTQVEIKNILILGRFILSIGEGFAALAGLTVIYFILACISLHISTKPARILF